ncbi:MAG: alginate export family protein [candidate division Zixibacteria bacterium]|nr:alginate export family protein [candidate division Zixibacteria bacterium]
MKGLIKGLLILAIALVAVVPAAADTEINFSGQVRLREEIDDKNLDTSQSMVNFADLRTRLAVEAVVDGNTRVFIQLQDSRRMGGFDQFGNRTSGELNDGKSVELHQAYFHIDNLFAEGIGMKAGRFELAFGNGRVFSPCGWSQVGRSWEGSMGWFDHSEFKITAFGLKAMERNNPKKNADFDIAGVYATIKDINLDLFGLYEYDADTSGNYWLVNNVDRTIVGAYFTYEYERFDVILNAVRQGGNIPRGLAPADTADNDDKLCIKACMLTAEVGYSFEGQVTGRLAAGIDYTSGDDDPGDGDFKAYNNLYLAGHKFQGYMNFFTATAVANRPYQDAGLVDWMFRAQMEPADGWWINADAHFFSTAADYVNPLADTTVTKDVGVELDAKVATTRVHGIHIEVGGSMFFVEDAFAGVQDMDPRLWLYTMMTVNF